MIIIDITPAAPSVVYLRTDRGNRLHTRDHKQQRSLEHATESAREHFREDILDKWQSFSRCRWKLKTPPKYRWQLKVWELTARLGRLWILACIHFPRKSKVMGLLWFDAQFYAFGHGTWDPQFESPRIEVVRADRIIVGLTEVTGCS